MKKIAILLSISLFALHGSLFAEVLDFHYHVHYFTDDAGTTAEQVDEFVKDLNLKLTEQFNKVSGDTTGTIKLYPSFHQGLVDPEKIDSRLIASYPGVVIAQGAAGRVALERIRALKLIPLVIILYDVPNAKDLHFDRRIRTQISVFGEDSKEDSLLEVSDKDRQINIAIKGFDRLHIFSTPKLRTLLVDVEYRAILEAILWGTNQYSPENA